jgi:hypothetical protein
MDHISRKNKRHTSFPRNSSLANAAQNFGDDVRDNTDSYFLLVNKCSSECVRFFEKQKLHVPFRVSQYTYFDMHFQLFLV